MFKGKTPDMHDVGEKLKVQTALEGSVQKSGSRLRITAQLINIADGYHLWSEKYDRELKDVFAIQDEISLAIVNALKLELTPEEIIKIARRPFDNVQAYDLHVRARYEMWQGTKGALEHAMQLVRSGLEIIGENEILYADLGQGYIFYNDAGIKKEESLFDKTEECIRKIFALNPESSYGHFLRGMILRRRGNAQDAVKEFKHALAINPNNPEFMLWLAWVYIHSGRGYAARPLVNKLFEIDPLTPFSHYGAGVLELINGRFDAGLKELSRALQLEENNPFFQYWYARDLAYAHRYEEAYKLFGLIGKDAPETIWAKLGAFFMFALQDKKAEALQIVTEEFKRLAKEDEMFPVWMAESYALINEKNEAIDWLENGVKWGFINYPFLAEYDPFLANIRSEPRFQKLMERVKYEWEHFEE
jgi:tetratricopeptide (TPR) repeat protein